MAGIEVTRPPWNYWWMFTLENWVGLPGIRYGELAFFVLLILPFVDRTPEPATGARRPLAMTLALVLTLTVIALTC